MNGSTSNFNPLNRCVYCRSEHDLRDEHIVPLCLGGEWILPKSSCNSCEKITSAFEGKCASTLYPGLRLRYNLPTRRPKKRPKFIGIEYTSGDSNQIVQVPALGVQTGFTSYAFKEVGCLNNPPTINAGWEDAILIGIPLPNHIGDSINIPNESFRITVQGNFQLAAILHAKIAHVAAVAQLGMDSFTQWLPDFILGKNVDLPLVVGSSTLDRTAYPSNHQLAISIEENSGCKLVIAHIRLFSWLGGHHVKVVVGSTEGYALEDFCNARLTTA